MRFFNPLLLNNVTERTADIPMTSEGYGCVSDNVEQVMYLRECGEVISVEGTRKTKSSIIVLEGLHEHQVLLLNAFLGLRIRYFKN